MQGRELRCAAKEMVEVRVNPSPPNEKGSMAKSQELYCSSLCILWNAPQIEGGFTLRVQRASSLSR